MDLETAIEFINQITAENVGRSLRPPEITIMEGTWKGLTYAQMADVSSYSTNYLMRDIGPKFWRLLSDAFGEPISKTNIRVVLDRVNRGSISGRSPSLPSEGLVSDRGQGGNSFLRRSGKENSFSISSPTMVPAQNWSTLDPPASVYGRHSEITTLQQWLTHDQVSVLGLWGLSGIGKTTVLRMLAAQVQEHYDQILWRSLQYAPRLQDLLASLPNSPERALTLSNESALVECLNLLQSQSYMLILDDVDGILQGQQLAGLYQPRYEVYGDLFQRFCTKNHNGCVVLSGLEPCKQVLRLQEQNSLVRLFPLRGLSTVDSISLLEGEQLSGAEENWNQLVHYYDGHPLGLKLASNLVRDLFHGNATEFLEQKLCLLDDIRHLLEKTINRLSPLELEIVYFLATSGQSASLTTLQNELAMANYPIKLLEALDSLKQRSLLQTVQGDDQSLFTLDLMVKETVIKRLISQVGGSEATPPASQRYHSAAGIALRLTPATPEKVHLSHWLNGQFSPAWQAITALFGSPMKASVRLRSTYQLRDEAVIKRFKRIRLGGGNASHPSVLLLVAINRESDKTVQVCIQSQPDQANQLPPGLALCLLDGDAQILAQVNADEQDSFIQLPYFSGGFQESFSIQLQLDSLVHTEEFVI